MANIRITMRKLKELLRLHFDAKLTNRAVARSLKISKSTVHSYLTRFAASGLSWPLDESIDETTLDQMLFPEFCSAKKPDDIPDGAYVHQELKKPGVTLTLLWEEYFQDHPYGYQYSRYCDYYKRYVKKLHVTMRQTHKAGEKLFVDYAGQTMPVTDPLTGVVRHAQIFIAVMGASGYTFGEATWSQQIPDWVGSHLRAFEFFGGVPELLIPDNLKSGVTKADRYDPDLNPTYRDMARHYGTAVMPARVRKPRDKSKAEGGVLLAERWILAALRKQTFFSLEELNTAVRGLLIRLNQRLFKKLPGSRESEFLRLDKPALKPLPPNRYTPANWLRLKVDPSYHLDVDLHAYSVPHHLVGELVDIRLTERIVEVFHHGKRITSHKRSHEVGGKTTLREHMPPSHQHYVDWTPEKIMVWGEKAGYETYCLFSAILADRDHSAIAYRVCQGIVRLEKEYPIDRIEAACRRLNLLGNTRIESLKSILANGLDRLPVAPTSEPTPIRHRNIRGPKYYARKEVWALPL